MLEPREQMFIIKYLNLDDDKENIGEVYLEVFGREEGDTRDIRAYTNKAKKLIRTKRCQEYIARVQAKDILDSTNPEDIKNFLTRELLGLYANASTIIPTYDRNGKLQEGKYEFMDSTVVKSSIDMLGRSVGMFKDVVETKEEVINITIDGAKVENVEEKRVDN